MSSSWRSRAFALAVVLAVAVGVSAAVPTERAQAYRLSGQPWPRGTVTYHDGSPYHAAVRRAVAAWNASGARVRFVAVSRGRAAVQITAMSIDAAGEATLGYLPRRVMISGMWPPQFVRGGHVWLNPTSFRPLRAEYEDMGDVVGARIVAHELGHVIGLAHETRRCATMSPDANDHCAESPHGWQTRCRILELDDVRGAVRRYGGRVKRLSGPEFCDRFPAPPPPAALTASVDPATGAVTLNWKNATARHLQYVAISSGAGACPTALVPGDQHDFTDAAQASWSDGGSASGQGGGRYCYALWSQDEYLRPSAHATTIIVDVPPPSTTSDQAPPPRQPTQDSPPPDPPPPPDQPPAY